MIFGYGSNFGSSTVAVCLKFSVKTLLVLLQSGPVVSNSCYSSLRRRCWPSDYSHQLECLRARDSCFPQHLQTALEITRGNGSLVDFTVGENQGQGFPSIPGTPGLALELRYEHTTIAGGESFQRGILKAAEFWAALF